VVLRTILISVFFLGTIALTACGSSDKGASVSGNATYLQRMAVPDDSTVTVRIEDTSIADAAAQVIGEQVIQTNGKQVPFPFDVSYDPGKIDERHSYSLRVRIEDGAGKLLFINDTHVPVITQGNPTEDIEVILVPAGG